MSEDNLKGSEESTEKIEIFSTDDEKIKSFGEILTNDSSREILKLLFKKEFSANQLAQKTGVSLQLVKYHVNKMVDMGIAKISKIEKNIKGQDMKYYTATKFAIVILPSAVTDKAKESKSLKRSFSMIYKFAGVGIASVFSFFATQIIQKPGYTEPKRELKIDTEDPVHSGVESEKLLAAPPTPEMPSGEPVPQPEPEPQVGFDSDGVLEETLDLARRRIEATQANAADTGSFISSELFWPLVVAIAVLGIGLAIILFWRARGSSKREQTVKRLEN